MIVFGQICLLLSLISAGYAAMACFIGSLQKAPRWLSAGSIATVICALALTSVVGVLGWGLVARDFRLAYVAEYSSRGLPWHYCLSALWVGQAGSLLLWAWIIAGMALLFRFWPWQERHLLRDPALGIVMAFQFFLIITMVFAADPLATTHAAPRDGGGLSPLLQHPSMLIHPPVVFAGYAAWLFPFALAIAALATGHLDATWVRAARRWALAAWSVLGLGILLGAQWAYQELGWGGYWSWDPVENGSLIPWLLGTATIHGLMAWKHCGVLKKTSLALAIATFGLCNFATFLTRSGVFSSVHAFSKSTVGWLFLGLMIAIVAATVALIVWRRRALASSFAGVAILSRESLVLVSMLLLVALATVVFVGTLMGALSTFVLGRTILVGPSFYNYVLLPTGAAILAMTACAPLVRWRAPPTAGQHKLLSMIAAASLCVTLGCYGLGMAEPMTLGIIFLATLVFASLAGRVWLDLRERQAGSLLTRRREYAGYVVHIGFALLAVGVAGSSFGTTRHEVAMDEGQTITWAGRELRYERLIQRTLPDKLVAEAELKISRGGSSPVTVLPARHLHLLQNEWTTEVAIYSTWRGDFYVILHSGEGEGRITLSLIDNPLMRFMWLGGAIMGCGAVLAIWPVRRRKVAVVSRQLPIKPMPQSRRAA